MPRDRWGAEGPPPDSYSRVTNPERFAPLHAVVMELADKLADEFDVERTEAYGVDVELESPNPARPTLRLRPRDDAAASITISFTSFPGLFVRFGRWVMDQFPRCGCDACDESVEEEIERLQAKIEGVIAGAFEESISIDDNGTAQRLYTFEARGSAAEGIDLQEARDLLASAERSSWTYAPWPRRQS
jgi:hypothetical protein